MTNFKVLEVSYAFHGKQETLYPVVLYDGKEMILIDCGYAGFIPLIQQSATQPGIDLNKLTGIMITHHDMDHMGGLAECKAAYPLAKVYSSILEASYISGKKKSLRLAQAERLYPGLPEDQKPGALLFQQFLATMVPVEVDYTLADHEVLPFCGNPEIVYMPGHISLYVAESKTLIAADALVYEDGKLGIANPHYTLDLPAAIRSVQMLLSYEIETMLCYHGGLVQHNIQKDLQAIVDQYAPIYL